MFIPPMHPPTRFPTQSAPEEASRGASPRCAWLRPTSTPPRSATIINDGGPSWLYLLVLLFMLERVQVPLDWTGQPAPTAQVEGSRVPETCLLMGAK